MNQIVIFSIAILSIFLVLSVDQKVLGYGGPPEQSSSNNFTVQIYSDKESYTLGDTIVFSGTVNKYSEDRNLRISVFSSSQNLIVTQKVPVNEDRTFIHEIQLNEKFSEGDFLVKSQYGTKKTTVEIISFTISGFPSNNSKIGIPEWVKNNAGWWANGEIDDASFVSGIEFMISDGIIVIPNLPESEGVGGIVPEWVKNNAGWWANGEIDDASFVSGIEFMISDGIIVIK
jgi:hypothetical protein